MEQLVAQSGGFGDVQLAVEGEGLGEGGEVDGDEHELEPDAVAVEEEGLAGQLADRITSAMRPAKMPFDG